LLGHRLTAAPRVGAEQPDHHVDRDRQHPDHGPGQPGDHVERRRGEQRDRHGALQGKALGREFAEHQGKEGNAHGHDGEREWRRHPAGYVLPDQPVAQQPGQGVGAVGAGHQRGEGGADLHGRQEPVGVGGELRRLRPAPAALREPPHLALAQRDQGHLSGCEEPADGQDDEDDDNV
jgi:hypothetical protein